MLKCVRWYVFFLASLCCDHHLKARYVVCEAFFSSNSRFCFCRQRQVGLPLAVKSSVGRGCGDWGANQRGLRKLKRFRLDKANRNIASEIMRCVTAHTVSKAMPADYGWEHSQMKWALTNHFIGCLKGFWENLNVSPSSSDRWTLTASGAVTRKVTQTKSIELLFGLISLSSCMISKCCSRLRLCGEHLASLSCFDLSAVEPRSEL